MEDNTNGPVFRATKRRKVFRKRADSDANSDEPYVASTAQGPDATTTPVDATNNTADSHGDASTLPEAARVRRPKKHGIAFSSSDPFSSRLHSNEETAVVVSEDQTQDLTNGRFARQTGRTVVADDKHMSAYIDSKLAEMRSKVAIAPSSTVQSAGQAPETQQANPPQPTVDPGEGAETAPLSPPPQTNPIIQPTINSATTTKRRQPRRPRQPSPSTQARASLIDQIMRESNHTPHYTPPTTATTATKNPTATSTGEDLDPDAAAAAAFKADFLAQAEARNLSRRKPKAAATAGTSGAAAATTSHGPKLGGSRAARVRMRQAEEAAKGKK